MNKSFKLTSIALVLFAVSGCTQKAPTLPDSSIENSNSTVSESNSVTGGNMIGITDGASGGSLGVTPSSASAMNAGNVYNSSSDGFFSLYFDVNSYGISEDMQARVEKNVANLAKKQMKIKIEGNCDESGTDEYNYALGLKRAKAIKDAMVAKGSQDGSISIISLGESTPVCTEDTQECRMKNRRVDIKKVD